jgi:WXG100 family type VII secretion target
VAGYRVDTAELGRCDTLLAVTSERARHTLADVCAAADALLNGRWHGPAAAAFHESWTDWLAGTTAMLDALDVMAAALGSAGVGYAATDGAVRTGIARAAT